MREGFARLAKQVDSLNSLVVSKSIFIEYWYAIRKKCILPAK